MITLLKVDDRMIHGQIVIMWTKLRQGERLIVIVDDTTANDPFLKKSVEGAGLAVGKKTYVWSVAEAIEKMPKVIASDHTYFVIGKHIKELYEIYMAGIDMGKDIQYGTASTLKDGYVKVWHNINLSPEDIQMCEELHKRKIDITYKLIPSESGTTYAKERDKLLERRN